jgi:hypothetical protein
MKLTHTHLHTLLAGLIVANLMGCEIEKKEEEESDEATTKEADPETDAADGDDDEATEQVSQIEGVDYHRTSMSTPLAQSFLVADKFTLTQASLFVSNTNGSLAETILVVITKGGASPDLGERVSEWVTVESTLQMGETGWLDFALETPIELEAGQSYWLEVWPEEDCDIVEDASGPYADGEMLRMDGISSNWVSSQEAGQPVLGDMKFKISGY